MQKNRWMKSATYTHISNKHFALETQFVHNEPCQNQNELKITHTRFGFNKNKSALSISCCPLRLSFHCIWPYACVLYLQHFIRYIHFALIESAGIHLSLNFVRRQLSVFFLYVGINLCASFMSGVYCICDSENGMNMHCTVLSFIIFNFYMLFFSRK